MWTAWDKQDSVKVTWVTYCSTLFSFQENGNLLYPTGKGRLWQHLFEVATHLPCLFLQYLQLSVATHSKFVIVMNYWKLLCLKTLGWRLTSQRADGNTDVRFGQHGFDERMYQDEEAGPIGAQGCCYCCSSNWKVDYRHSQKKNQQRWKHAVLFNHLVSYYVQQQMLLHYLEHECIFKPGMKARHKTEFKVYLTH